MFREGTGRTRATRFAAVVLPATIASAGFGVAIVQGAVSAQLASANPFQVSAVNGEGSGLELSLRATQAAASETSGNQSDKGSLFVTLKDGSVSDVCLAANTPVPVIGNIGLQINVPSTLGLGEVADVNLTSAAVDSAALPHTVVGAAQDQLTHQGTVTEGKSAGSFGVESGGAPGSLQLDGIEASVYQVALDAIELDNLTVSPSIGAAATC